MYGPNTKAVESIMDLIPTLHYEEVDRLGATWAADWDAARDAYWSPAWYAARGAVNNAARVANRDAYWSTARSAAMLVTLDAGWSEARDAAWDASNDAMIAMVTYDLATIDGDYTIAQRDLLLAPWIKVCGMPPA